MSAKISTPFAWTDADADKLARNWTQDATGVQREMGNKASAIATLAALFNHLAARQAPVLFDMIRPRAEADETGADPLLSWRGPRRTDNGRTYVVRLTTAPRTLDSNASSYIERDGTAAGEQTPPTNAAYATLDPFYDVYAEEFESAERGSPSDLTTDGLTTVAGYIAYDVVVQEPGLSHLTTGTHLLCDPVAARPEGEVLVSHLPEVAHAFHRLRTTQLPRAMSWSSLGQEAADALAITNAGRVNLFDLSATARDENSVGATFYCFRSGVGREDQAPGQRVPISCRVKANAAAATNIRFEGPSHLAGNEINIEVPAGGGPAWYEATGCIWGNPQADENCANVDRNKIDAFSEGVASGTLRVYGVQCELNSPMPFV